MEDIADSPIIPNNNDEQQQQAQVAPAASENTYDDLFPALPDGGSHSLGSVPSNKMNKMKVGSSQVTQVFTVPGKERKMESDKFGERESLRTCQNIMKDTGAHIEISSSKDMTLTFVITGKQSEVMEARRKILLHFQTQTSKQIALPKECRGHILGRKGERLKELEKMTATKISMPVATDESEMLTITGTPEGIEKAEHDIRQIVAEQSKKSVDRIKVPKIYYPFILGPHNEKLNRMMEETGAKINVPPMSVDNTEIIITGEKESVQAARNRIDQIHKEMEKTCKIVSVEVPKAQHKYIYGYRWATIHEILSLTGVSVELPPNDVMTDTITLRGPQECLGKALSLVYEKANSVRSVLLDAPSWIHKYIVGRKRPKDWATEYPDVHIDADNDKIKIEGHPEQVDKVSEEVSKLVEDYVTKYRFWEMEIDPKHSKHIIGKAGSNINRLQEELGVQIFLEETKGVKNTIRIEGPHESISKAEKEIREKIDKLENEKEKDVIIDHRLFPKLIGAKGEKIKEIRDKYKKVQITFPNSNEKTDIVKLRGRKDEVDACHKHLMKIVKDMQESAFMLEVPIFKKLHRYIIGKQGVNIRKIREDTHTSIDLPAETEENDVIVITGKKQDVFEARDRILKIQNELGTVSTAEIDIPTEYHLFLIGVGGKIVSQIMEECGGVSIRFPSQESKSSKVMIKGLAEDVEKAKQQLLKLSKEQQENSKTTIVKAKPQYHKFLIGKNGATIKKIRESTGAYVIIPSADSEDNESITIIGKEADIQVAKQQLEAILKDIDNIVEDTVEVDPKHHRHFMQRRRKIVDKISEECGGITISFPRNGEESSVVTLKGAKDCIEVAKARILEIVSDLENQVTIECEIPQKLHRQVMGSRGKNVQDITARFDVQIKFPSRNLGGAGDGARNETSGENAESINGDVMNGSLNPDSIKITGTPAKTEAAKEALLGLIQEISVPYEMHKQIIGPKGQKVRELMNQHDVYIELSPASEKLDLIKIVGAPENVEEAKNSIAKRVEEIELEKKDRELKSFELKIEVDPSYHNKIIGRKGAVINQIRADFDVQISFPARNEEIDNIVTIQGYEESCYKTRDAIMKIVNELDSVTKESLEVDPRILRTLIGARGKNIRQVMEDYKVEIKIPRSDDPNPNAIMIIGLDENIAECKQYIMNFQDEFMDNVAYMHKPQHVTLSQAFEDVLTPASKPSDSREPKHGFVVKGAPWGGQQNNRSRQAPKQQQKPSNPSSHVDFPEFGLNANNAAPATETEGENAATANFWGQPR